MKLSAFLLSAVALVSSSVAFAETPLELIMQKMGSTLQGIEAKAAEPKSNADSALLSYDLENLSMESKKYLPPKVENMVEGPDRDAKVVLYKIYMNRLARQSMDLEEAFLNNKNETVPALIMEIKKTRKAAHDEFRE